MFIELKYYPHEIFGSKDYYPGGMLQPGRSYSSTSYKYGFNGMEKDDEVKGNGNSLDFGARMYDSRLMRWMSVDPIPKAQESPYTAFSNNPIVFIDPDGKDTLFFHVKQMESVGGNVILKITFSIVKNGIEKKIEPKLPKGSENVYFLVPKAFWKPGNKWNEEQGKDFQIRFESYNDYKNSIRLKYTNEPIRILAHYGRSTGWSIGCNIPSTCSDNLDSNGELVAENPQEVLDAIYNIFIENIPSESTTNKHNRTVQEPMQGHDMMAKSNSEAIDYIPSRKAGKIENNISEPKVTK